jgi:class 3 adenylate cyclase/tetratricopeptide (TPR) repeat protein
MLCSSCGRENPEGFTFCGHCAAPLEAETSVGQEVRKTVTVLFCDVTGSTQLGERLDPETVRRVMGRYFDEMRSVLASHGGTVEKFIGDAIMAVFGVPTVHEDDALRAIRAAHEMRERLGRLNKELERDHGVTIVARIGVNTGEVVAGTGEQTLATGDAVNVAARLEQSAQPGEILFGADTHRLVRDAVEAEPVGPLEVKGKAEPIHAFRLGSVEGPEGLARRFDVPMVGRTDELRALSDALHRAGRDRACILVSVLGPAGVGKSRIVQEFLEREATSAAIVRGRCLPYGEGITYWPVVEMLTAGAAIADLDGPDEVRSKIHDLVADAPEADLITERLAQLLGVAGAEAAPEETHWAVRKLFEAMAASAPLVVVFDDVHWAEPALLDLIEHVADWSRDAPILLLCDARPELLDRRPGWGGGKLNATSFLLEPLSEVECDEFVANLLDRADLPERARRKIIEAAEGNPLFVEHMVAMLIDDGLLRRDDNRWVVDGDLSVVSAPASIMALLEARLERLTPDERVMIERASIEGKRFHVGSVRALSAEGDNVSEPLMALVRRDLIRPDRAVFTGDEAFRFRHILIRDAAYQRIPKETRAELHERHAAWLERTVGDRLAEFDEFVGFHLEQAYRLRSELGPLDAASAELAVRAAGHLVAGAGRAADRGDVRASSGLLSRALGLLPPDHPRRPTLLTDLSVQLAEAGQTDLARSAVEEAEAALGSQPDPSQGIALRFARLTLASAMEPEGVALRMKEEALRAIPQLEAIGDEAGLSRAWQLLGDANLFWANDAGVLDAFGRAIDHADRAGDRQAARRATAWSAVAIFSGPTPVDEGLRLLDALEARAPGDVQVSAWTGMSRGVLFAMSGRVDEGRNRFRTGRAVFIDLGLPFTIGGMSQPAGLLEEMAGDLAAAERELRAGYELLASLGEKGFLSTVAGSLARCVAKRGRLEEAEELARIGERASATDDVYSQVTWRQALALVQAQRGEPDRALALAREAVGLAEPTDDCPMRAGAFEDLAEVHRLAGRIDEAAEALARAIGIWDEKGAIFVANRLRARLTEVKAP